MRQLPFRFLWSAVSVLAALSCSAASAAGAQWEYSTVDSAAMGHYSSLKVDNEGNAHVAYVASDGQNTLKYGFWDHRLNRWFVMKVDTQASFCALTLDSKQRPHISYADFGSSKEGRLHYAYWNGSAWTKKTITLNDGAAFYTSIALDSEDKPYISYYDYLAPDNEFVLHLRVAHWNGKYWEVRTADDVDGSGKFNSITVDATGNPQIAYANVKDPNQGLRYARWTSSGWEHELLDSPCYVWSVGMVLDKAGKPHISYMDHHHKLLKYATLDAGKWQIYTIATLEGVAYPDRNGITIGPDGKIYITCYDSGSGSLLLIRQELSNWVIEIVDQGRVGFTSSVAVDGNNILITYTDEATGVLKFARRPITQTESAAK